MQTQGVGGLGCSGWGWVGSQTPLVQPCGPLGPGFPHTVQLSSLTLPSHDSPPDDHKPIWMHAEEREEMSKVSGGAQPGEPKAARAPILLLALAQFFTSQLCPSPGPMAPSPSQPAPWPSLHSSVSILTPLLPPHFCSPADAAP